MTIRSYTYHKLCGCHKHLYGKDGVIPFNAVVSTFAMFWYTNEGNQKRQKTSLQNAPSCHLWISNFHVCWKFVKCDIANRLGRLFGLKLYWQQIIIHLCSINAKIAYQKYQMHQMTVQKQLAAITTCIGMHMCLLGCLFCQWIFYMFLILSITAHYTQQGEVINVMYKKQRCTADIEQPKKIALFYPLCHHLHVWENIPEHCTGRNCYCNNAFHVVGPT